MWRKRPDENHDAAYFFFSFNFFQALRIGGDGEVRPPAETPGPSKVQSTKKLVSARATVRDETSE